MTPAVLALCTGARPREAALHAGPLTRAMAEFEIDTPVRMAMFLAQVAHETLRLRYLVEIWGPTLQQERYEGRLDLGNTEPGDGKRFCGRGDIMVTGRANYLDAGRALGYDLLLHPAMLGEPLPAARAAGWYWQRHALNAFADRGEFDHVCDIVNRGHVTEKIGDANGYRERLAYWSVGKVALGVTP